MASHPGIKQLTLMMLAIGIQPEECHDAAQELFAFLTTSNNEHGTDIQIDEAIMDWIGLSEILTPRTSNWCTDNFDDIVDTINTIFYGSDPISIYLRTGQRSEPKVGFIGAAFSKTFQAQHIINIGIRQPDVKLLNLKRCTSDYYLHDGELHASNTSSPRIATGKEFKNGIEGAIYIAQMLGAK